MNAYNFILDYDCLMGKLVGDGEDGRRVRDAMRYM